jgi:hypothetical protein
VSFVAVKNLFEQPLRLAFSVLGVALAVMMILVMWAILQGVLAQAGAYVKHTEAQIWVVQRGFTDIAHGFSVVPAPLEEELERIPGVRSANPITAARTEVPIPADGEEAVSVVGYDPETGVGGPWEFATEPAVPRSGEVVADETFAQISGLEVGFNEGLALAYGFNHAEARRNDTIKIVRVEFDHGGGNVSYSSAVSEHDLLLCGRNGCCWRCGNWSASHL